MMCKKPFVKCGPNVTRTGVLLSRDMRDAATPFPCGQCLHCRINKSREWQHRLLLENMVADKSCFVTITYNNENVPKDMSLKPDDVQKFMKRLRYYLDGIEIRYFIVGEYGDKTERPHYHAAFFGVGIEDVDSISKAWYKGFIQVGDLNKDSARYIVGYVVKNMKKKGDKRLKGRHPEFMRCSKQKGGIGIGAINIMAEKLKGKNVGKIIREVYHGKKGYPLGRYLIRKLAERMGIDDNTLAWDFWEHQEELFNEHMGNDMLYMDSILNESYGKRRVQERKQKIFNRRSSL